MGSKVLSIAANMDAWFFNSLPILFSVRLYFGRPETLFCVVWVVLGLDLAILLGTFR